MRLTRLRPPERLQEWIFIEHKWDLQSVSLNSLIHSTWIAYRWREFIWHEPSRTFDLISWLLEDPWLNEIIRDRVDFYIVKLANKMVSLLLSIHPVPNLPCDYFYCTEFCLLKMDSMDVSVSFFLPLYVVTETVGWEAFGLERIILLHVIVCFHSLWFIIRYGDEDFIIYSRSLMISYCGTRCDSPETSNLNTVSCKNITRKPRKLWFSMKVCVYEGEKIMKRPLHAFAETSKIRSFVMIFREMNPHFFFMTTKIWKRANISR